LKSIRVGPSSRVVNEEFAVKIRIRITLVDFLPGLVAPRVSVFVAELGQQTLCAFLFFCSLFSLLYLFTASTMF